MVILVIQRTCHKILFVNKLTTVLECIFDVVDFNEKYQESTFILFLHHKNLVTDEY